MCKGKMFKLLLVALFANFLLAPSDANKKKSCNVEDSYSRLNYASTKLMLEFLYQQVTDQPYKTIVTSSLPALVILGVMGLHTKENSNKEILNLLHLDDKSQIKDVFEYAIPLYTSNKGVRSKLKFKIDADDKVSFRNHFKEVFKKFNGVTENIDACRADVAAENINKWARSQDPHNKTQDVISACEIHEGFGMFVTGAHTIVVGWDHPFNPQGMIDIDFHISKDRKVTLPSLYGNGYLNYADYSELDCKLVEIPFDGNQFTLFLFVPNQEEGLLDLLKKLRNPDVFGKAYNSMQRRCININVPLGEVHSTVDIRENLIAANYSSLFDPKTANLKGISKKNNYKLYIQQFRHAISVIGNAQVGNITDSSDPSSDVCCGQEYISLEIKHPFAYFIIGPHITTIIGGAYFGNT